MTAEFHHLTVTTTTIKNMKSRLIIFLSLIALIILALIILALYPAVWLFEYSCLLMRKINDDINPVSQ